jgi:hypothetical protein
MYIVILCCVIVIHYMYKRDSWLYCSLNLTDPPHQSPDGGSVSWGTGSDTIWRSGSQVHHLVQYPGQRPANRRFSGYLRPRRLTVIIQSSHHFIRCQLYTVYDPLSMTFIQHTVFNAILHIWRPSISSQPTDTQCCGDNGPPEQYGFIFILWQRWSNTYQ